MVQHYARNAEVDIEQAHRKARPAGYGRFDTHYIKLTRLSGRRLLDQG